MNNYNNKKSEHINKLVDEKGNYFIMAIDHREVYTNLMLEFSGSMPSSQEVVNSKIQIIKAFANSASGFLIDPLYGIPNIIESGAMGNKGFMVGVEGDDYSTATFKEDYLNPNISVDKINECGGNMVKLFILYNSNSPIAAKQEQMIDKLAKECSNAQLPFLLEPIMYFENTPTQKEREEEFRVMLKRLSKYDIDVFKLEFPGDINNISEQENINACLIAKEELKVPWILLSSGANREVFLKQLKCAVQGGASGFAIGRSLWGDCVGNNDSTASEKWQDMKMFFEKAKLTVAENKK